MTKKILYVCNICQRTNEEPGVTGLMFIDDQNMDTGLAEDCPLHLCDRCLLALQDCLRCSTTKSIAERTPSELYDPL